MTTNPPTGQQGRSAEPNPDALWKTLDLNVGWIKHAEVKGGASSGGDRCRGGRADQRHVGSARPLGIHPSRG